MMVIVVLLNFRLSICSSHASHMHARGLQRLKHVHLSKTQLVLWLPVTLQLILIVTLTTTAHPSQPSIACKRFLSQLPFLFIVSAGICWPLFLSLLYKENWKSSGTQSGTLTGLDAKKMPNYQKEYPVICTHSQRTMVLNNVVCLIEIEFDSGLCLKICVNFICQLPFTLTLWSSGFQVSEQALDEVAELSQVMTVGNDFLTPAVRAECERVIPQIEDVKPSDAATTFLFLKTHYNEPSSRQWL